MLAYRTTRPKRTWPRSGSEGQRMPRQFWVVPDAVFRDDLHEDPAPPIEPAEFRWRLVANVPLARYSDDREKEIESGYHH